MSREPVLQCYRAACTKAAHPCGYHRETHGLYCLVCARDIEAARAVEFLPFFPLLKFALGLKPVDLTGGSFGPGIVVVRPAPTEPRLVFRPRPPTLEEVHAHLKATGSQHWMGTDKTHHHIRIKLLPSNHGGYKIWTPGGVLLNEHVFVSFAPLTLAMAPADWPDV